MRICPWLEREVFALQKSGKYNFRGPYMRILELAEETRYNMAFRAFGRCKYIHCGEELLMVLRQLHGIKFMLIRL